MVLSAEPFTENTYGRLLWTTQLRLLAVVMSSQPQWLASLTSPATGARNSNMRSTKLEDDYGDTLQMRDLPRDSFETSQPLLHSPQSGSCSTGSSNPFVEPERSFAPQLTPLPEDYSNDVYNDKDDMNDSECFPPHNQNQSDTTTVASSSRRGRARRCKVSSALLLAVQESAINAAVYVKENSGLLMIVSAQAAFAGMNALVKVMTSNEVAVPIWEIIFLRMAMTWFCCYLYMRIMGIEDALLGPKAVRGWLVVRGIAGFFGLFGSYYSLQYLSLSDATILAFLAPTATAILAAVALKEPYTLKEAIAGTISLGGAVLVAQPSFLLGSTVEQPEPGQRLLAVGVALGLGVCFAAAAYVTIRHIGKQAHALHTVSYFCLGCVFISILTPLFVKTQRPVLPYKPIFWLCLIGIGICGFVGQFLTAKALQVEKAGRALLGSYTILPWALLLQFLIFGEVMDLLSTLGAVVIMGSTCWVVLTKQKGHEFDSDGEAGGSQRTPQAGASIRYTALSDQEEIGMEAGLRDDLANPRQSQKEVQGK